MSRRKLLLADDSITIQKVVNLTFADEGIDVVAVGDGNAALAQLALETPDIVLADVNMPGPTGYEICEQLRTNDATRPIPVILLVGSFEPFDEAEAARVGANAYLTKPFQSIKQLIAQVNELIDAARPAAVESAPVAVAEVPASEVQPAPAEPAQAEASRSVESPVDEVPATPDEQAVFDDLGYKTGASQEAPQTTEPAPDDIDNLYEQSISGGPDNELSDVGIDDEMIETSYSAKQANDEMAEFAPKPLGEQVPELPATEHQPTAFTTLDPVAQQVAEEPVAEKEATETVPSVLEAKDEFRSGYDQRFPDDPSKFENTISYENWQPVDMRGEGAEVKAANQYETTRLDEPAPEPQQAVPAAPTEVPTEAPTVGEDTIRMENRFDTAGSSFKFDDADLLDLSSNADQPVEITSPVHAVEQGGNKQVVTISPELIEMIAQRVVEKLSEKY